MLQLFHKILLLYFGIIIYFDWFQVVAQGVFRGCGYQNVGAIINTTTLLLVGLPLGIGLALKTSLTAVGYWLGVLAALILQFIAYFTMTYRMNWQKESELARNRAGVTKEESHPLLKGGPARDSEPKFGEGHSTGYGGVEVCFANQDITSNGGTVRIPLKTIFSRLCILLFSLALFIASLVFRLVTVG